MHPHGLTMLTPGAGRPRFDPADDRVVSRRDVLRLEGRKRHRRVHGLPGKSGSTPAPCARGARCRSGGAHDVRVLLDRYAFGHADCGAVQLAV